MEIYHRKIRWFGLVFTIPAAWLSLSLAGYTDQHIGSSEIIATYVVIGVCLVISLQCFMGSTRFYFDNEEKSGIQIRKSFYGVKIVRHPYSDILGVAIRCYSRGNNTAPLYRVGITESARLFGQNATKFTELRSFGGSEEECSAARDFAQEICVFTQLNLIDDSGTVRPEMGSHFHVND